LLWLRAAGFFLLVTAAGVPVATPPLGVLLMSAHSAPLLLVLLLVLSAVR
jgi:hypothetical protein